MDDLAEVATLFAAEHRLIEATCEKLEAIADALPDAVDFRLVAEVLPVIRHAIGRHCKAEERDLMAVLRARRPKSHEIKWTVSLLRQEHEEQEALAYELVEWLEAFAETGRAQNAAALGYLIRLFCMALRRHMRWEECTLMRMARE